MYQRMNYNKGRESLFSSNTNRTTNNTRDLMEDENNDKIDHLSLQINTLKELTHNIHNEVTEQNRFLDGMGNDFDRTGGLLGGTLHKMGKMLEQGGSKHMCYLICFVVFIFVLLYYAMRKY